MARARIDKLVVERGLAQSRTQAQALILAGQVLANEQRIDKPGQLVDSAAQIRIKGQPPKYVSRGGIKLEAALHKFNIDPTGKHCIDIGASTGGFTDCLLQHGAAGVWAVDVGHNQLDWRVRKDSRVRVVEGMNARQLEPSLFPVLFDLATIDVSFISVTKLFDAVARVLTKSADLIVLVKPQFEVGKGEVGKGGIVTNPLKHQRVLDDVIASAKSVNLAALDVTESPILGAAGNREFLIHLRRPKDIKA